MVKKYIFKCTRSAILDIEIAETSHKKLINNQEAIQIDIQIEGYNNDQQERFLTEDQFHVIFNALKKVSIKASAGKTSPEIQEIFTIRYHVLLLDAYNKNDKSTLVINSCMYSDAGYDPHSKSAYLGYGGRKFKYKRYDSDEPVLTNNMWNGTELPEYLLDFMPDNAEWVKL